MLNLLEFNALTVGVILATKIPICNTLLLRQIRDLSTPEIQLLGQLLIPGIMLQNLKQDVPKTNGMSSFLSKE